MRQNTIIIIINVLTVCARSPYSKIDGVFIGRKMSSKSDKTEQKRLCKCEWQSENWKIFIQFQIKRFIFSHKCTSVEYCVSASCVMLMLRLHVNRIPIWKAHLHFSVVEKINSVARALRLFICFVTKFHLVLTAVCWLPAYRSTHNIKCMFVFNRHCFKIVKSFQR